MAQRGGRTRSPDEKAGVGAGVRIGDHPSFTSNVVPLQVKEKPLPAATKCIG
jgi:hypothetical protein